MWKSGYPWDVRIEKICLALHNAGFEVYIICRWEGEELDKDVIDGINIIRVGYNQNAYKFSPLPFNPFWRKALEKLILDIKPNLIINREIILADISGKLAKKYNIPIIMDMAENYPSAMQNWKKYTNSFVKRLIFKHSKLVYNLEKMTSKMMNGILVVCEENKDRIIKKYRLDKDNIEVVYNTPPKDFFNFKRFEDDRPYKIIAYHGFINTERNLEFFLNVAKDFNDFEFHIWGKVTSDSNIKSAFSKYPNIKFFGEYKLKDLNEIIKKSDIGLLPYILDEHINNTISNKFFDYMANGIPIICSKAKPMMRLIDELGVGVYFDFSNKENIENALFNLTKYDFKNFGENGFQAFRDKFNWENDKKRLISFVEKFI